MQCTIDIVPPAMRRYVGLAPHLEDQMQRARHRAFTLITESLAGPDTPFGRLARNGLLLNEQTHRFLYEGNYGFLDQPYIRGSRPLLEAWVARHVRPGMSAGETAVALSQSLDSELRRAHPPVPVFLYGESDEETILKGGGHCSCKARLLCALCQVAGLEARPAMMWLWADEARDPNTDLGGHTVAEVYIDGQWGFFDPQHHCYCRTADGTFPSLAQIRRQPELLTKMPDEIVEAMQPLSYPRMLPDMNLFEYYWYKNFNPKCPLSITRHDVNDPGTPHWHWATPELRQKQAHDYAMYKELLLDLAQRGELTDDIYTLPLAAFREKMGINSAQLPVFA